MTARTFSRRRFLSGAAGGLVVAFVLEGPGRLATRAIAATLDGGAAPTAVNGWIRIGADDIVTILFGGGEMGQGIASGLAQIAAEELAADWANVRVESAPASQSWLTGGSSGIRSHQAKLRLAGAQAREMLIAAAAQTWNVDPATCTAVNGTVVAASGDVLRFGELATLAATMPVPSNPPLRAPGDYRIVGQPVPRPDLPSKVDGSAIYGIDVRIPGMVYAVIKHCPTFGGRLQGTPSKPAGAMAVVPLSDAVAVVATNTWQAMQAADELEVSWTTPSSAGSNDGAAIAKEAQRLMSAGPAVAAETNGDATAGLATAAKTIDVTYSLPYVAHACMEVLNCTVDLRADGCDVWAPTQAPNLVLSTVASITGLAANQITVHPTLLGGGLGRKFEQDYIREAVLVAKALGKPVKLTWPRSEDFQHDQYRPMALSRVRAGIDGSGDVTAWSNRIVSPSILFQRGWIGANAVDSQATDGAVKLPYAFGTRLVEYVRHGATVPVGFWRSVGNSINAFVVESAVDELAAAAGADPVAFRRKLLAGNDRSSRVLDAAAALGGWGAPLPAGHARGIALSHCFGSIVAQVVEISQQGASQVLPPLTSLLSGTPQTQPFTVERVACVVDCGTAINPDSVVAQMQGGIVHGLSTALWGEVTFTNGKANVSNFNRYRMLRLAEMPDIDVEIIQSGAPIGGIGEVGVPAIAPAVANAYYSLTGSRVRSLPMFPGSTMPEA